MIIPFLCVSLDSLDSLQSISSKMFLVLQSLFPEVASPTYVWLISRFQFPVLFGMNSLHDHFCFVVIGISLIGLCPAPWSTTKTTLLECLVSSFIHWVITLFVNIFDSVQLHESVLSHMSDSFQFTSLQLLFSVNSFSCLTISSSIPWWSVSLHTPVLEEHMQHQYLVHFSHFIIVKLITSVIPSPGSAQSTC